MKNLVVTIEPFDFTQHIYLFENGTLQTTITASFEDLPERIVKLTESDDITHVNVKGSVDFASKLKERIRETEMTTYGTKKLNIVLV